jgi:hypothetical protein
VNDLLLTRDEIVEITKNIVSFGVEDADVDCYIKYIRPLPAGSVIVDFGTGRGKNVTRIALANPDAIVFTFDNAEEHEDIATPRYFMEITNRIRSRGANNVYFTLANSMESFADWDIPIDAINIDSSHKYENTKRELEKWIPFVKVGGYILLHDYERIDPRTEGERIAANEYLKNENFEFIENIGATQVVRKIK